MYVVWICMAGFLAGILYANVLAADEIAGIGIFQEYFLGRFSGVEILSADYIWYIAPESFCGCISGLDRLFPGAYHDGGSAEDGRKGAGALSDCLDSASFFLCGRLSDSSMVSVPVSGGTVESV